MSINVNFKIDTYLLKKENNLLLNLGQYYNIIMEYQKIVNLLNNESNKPSKFRTKNWVEINYDVRGVYSPNKQIRFKTSMLRSSLCDYSDAYILVKGNITVNNTADAGAAGNDINKKVIFKNCTSFTNHTSKINNTEIDNAEYIDLVMRMYNVQNIGIITQEYLEAYGNILKIYLL